MLVGMRVRLWVAGGSPHGRISRRARRRESSRCCDRRRGAITSRAGALPDGAREQSAGAGAVGGEAFACRLLRVHLGWAWATGGGSQSVVRSGVLASRSLAGVELDEFPEIALRFFGASASTGCDEFLAGSWRELLEKK